MKRILAPLALALALLAAPTDAAADYSSGSYTDSNGLTCTWNGFGSIINLSCSGYSWQAGQFISYNCTITRFGSMSSYTCNDYRGRFWSGSN